MATAESSRAARRVAIVGAGGISGQHAAASGPRASARSWSPPWTSTRTGSGAFRDEHGVSACYTDRSAAEGRPVHRGEIAPGDPFYAHLAGTPAAS